MLDDLVGQVMHVDHCLGDAGAAELVEHVVEQWLAGNPNQRLRQGVGEGAHAQAETGGEDHGFGGMDGHSFRGFSNSLRQPYHGDSADTGP